MLIPARNTIYRPLGPPSQEPAEDSVLVISDEERAAQLKKVFLEKNKQIEMNDISVEAIVALQHLAKNAIFELDKAQRKYEWDLNLYSLKIVRTQKKRVMTMTQYLFKHIAHSIHSKC